MANVLEYILKIKDEATKEIDKFGKSVDANNGNLQKLQKTAGVMGAAITGMGIAGVFAMKDWAMAAAEAELETSKANALLENAAKDMKVSFESLNGVVTETSAKMIKLGFDDEETALQFSKLIASTHDTALAQKALAAAADLSSSKGISLEASVKAVNLAMMGSPKLLKEYQIELKEGASALEVLNAINGKMGGTAEKNSKTFAVSMQAMDIQIANLKETLGAEIIPMLSKFVGAISGVVEKLNSLPQDKVELFVKIFAIGTAIALVIGPLLMFVALLPAIGAGFTIIGASIGPFLLIVGAIAAVVAAGYLLINNWELIKSTAVTFFENIKKFIGEGLVAIGEFFVNLGTTITTFFQQLPINILTFLGQTFLNFVTFIGQLVGYVMYGLPLFLETVDMFLRTLPGRVAVWLLQTLTEFITWGTNTWNYLKTNVPVWFNNVVTWAMALPGRISAGLSTLGSTIVKSFGDAWNNLVAELGRWKDNIWEWGKNIAASFIEGFKNALKAIGDAFKTGVQNAKDSMEGHSPPKSGPLKNIDKWGFNIGNAWVDGLREAIDGFSMPSSQGSQSTYHQNINVTAPINNNLDAYSLASILGQQLAFAGKYD